MRNHRVRRLQRLAAPPAAGKAAGDETLEKVLAEVRACGACDGLPLGPRPVFQLSRGARLLIASQAPGSKVHASGIPFSDLSGVRLRDWTGLSEAEFYDSARVAILPMAFCYPGRGRSGDAPPRAACAPMWRVRLLSSLDRLRLTLLVGSHAQVHALGPGTMTDRVRAFREYLPDYFPLPHPSWRSRLWMARNPWFEIDVLPVLREKVRAALCPMIPPTP